LLTNLNGLPTGQDWRYNQRTVIGVSALLLVALAIPIAQFSSIICGTDGDLKRTLDSRFWFGLGHSGGEGFYCWTGLFYISCFLFF